MGAHCCNDAPNNSEATTTEPLENDDKMEQRKEYFTVTTEEQTTINVPLQIITLPDFCGETQTIEMQPLIQYYQETSFTRADHPRNGKLLNVIKKLQNIAQGTTENIEHLNEDESEQIYEYLIAIIENKLQQILNIGTNDSWSALTVEHLWEIADIITYYGEFVYTETIIEDMFALGESWLLCVESHHVKDPDGEWIGGFVHVLQYIEMQAQIEDDDENKAALLQKFNTLRDGAFTKILEYLNMDPVSLGDNKSFKNHLMFLSINTFEFIKNEWPQIKELAIRALTKLGHILNTKYEEQQWGETIGDTAIVKPFKSGTRQDDKRVHGACEWYTDDDNTFPEAVQLEHHSHAIGLDYNGLIHGEYPQVYFTAELPSEFLRAIAAKVNDEFQAIVRHTFGDWVSSATIKGESRMQDKLATNYKDKQVPKGAHILDVVRCLISCPTADDVIAVYKQCCDIFTAVRVKNGFAHDADVEFGYRTVFVNVLFESKDGKTRHICEIQITLDEVVHVRHYMHMFYKFRRAEEPANLL